MESDEREHPDRTSVHGDTAAAAGAVPAADQERTAAPTTRVFNPFDHDPAGAPGEPYRAPETDAPGTARAAQPAGTPGTTPTGQPEGAPGTAPADQPESAADARPAPALNEPPNAVVSGDPALSQRIVETLRSCYDPEIPVDIWELGLVYKVDIDTDGNVAVQMTLTSPMCPVAGSLPPEVESKVAGVEGVRDARVDLVWEPMWNKDMMSQAAMVKLNLI